MGQLELHLTSFDTPGAPDLVREQRSGTMCSSSASSISHGSLPPQATNYMTRRYPTVSNTSGYGGRTCLGLEFWLHPVHLSPTGELTVKCTAVISEVYYAETETFVVADLESSLHEAMSATSSSSGLGTRHSPTQSFWAVLFLIASKFVFT